MNKGLELVTELTLRGAPPVFRTISVRSFGVPGVTLPKSRVDGETSIAGPCGAAPVPLG